MEGYQERVKIEYEQLEQKVERLRVFLKSTAFAEASDEQQRLLRRQLPAMQMYAEILEQRIVDFERV